MPTRRSAGRGLTVLALGWACAAAGPVARAWPEPAKAANRLARETSPYLRLHARNPVDWYPWGPEAFARAKAEQKPVFLSVGYSACYWCHVMERESFDNPAIAKLLNAHFVCVKVDREERPDVDQVYMAALQVFGNGGWPMSMFLTPEGLPFFGGTYFPPEDRDGLEGFPGLIGRVAETWRDQRPAIEQDAQRLAAMVKRSLAGTAARRRVPLSRLLPLGGVEALTEQFDAEYGGFGFNPENPKRPKFPEPVNLVFLLDHHRREAARNPDRGRDKAKTADRDAEHGGPFGMALTTLDRMARGGIRDQLAGGYHRYATSRYWVVPHFEKMLYDNAQLASAHLLAFEATGDPRWRAEAEATFAFVARSMTAPGGGFYSSIDAETRGEEGAYYVWTREEVREALGDGADAEAFGQVYGLKREANFIKGRYVLLEPRTRAEQAATLKTTPELLERQLAPLRAKLLAVRDRRPAPLRDEKVLTAWNGLMVAAYADGYRVLKDDRYRAAAEKAADFLLNTLRQPDGRLLRTFCAGQAKLPGYLEDYAFLAHGLLRLHAATGDPKRLAQARSLTDRMVDDFLDTKEGGFFFTADDHESLIARPKDPFDNALPGGNSVAVRNLVALGVATKEPRYLDLAGATLDAFSGPLAQSPASVPLLLVALAEYLDARPEAPAVAARPDAEEGAGPVTARGSLVTAGEIAPGATFEAEVTLTIKPGWHAYANPTGLATVPPTRLTLDTDPPPPATLEGVTYPPGRAKVLAPSGSEAVALYEGTARLVARLKLDPQARPGPASVSLTLHYQACDDRACLAPVKRRVVIPLTVAGAK